MAQTFSPELVLTRITEFAKLKDDESIQSLVLDFFVNNKKKIFSISQENIIELFIKSCIQTRQVKNIREAFTYFRTITSNKLENFVNMIYLTKDLAEAELEKLKGVDTCFSEYHANDTPDAYLKLAIESLNGQNKVSEKPAQTVKFVWEIFKVLLDFTRVNNKLLEHYFKILKSTFQFCKRFNMKNEFNRICDSVRGYLQMLIRSENKDVNIPNKVELNNIAVVKSLIEIRSSLLETAIELQQWQEAFKICEDIILLLNKLNKKMITPIQYYGYFHKLSKLFDITEYHLFNAFSQISVLTHFRKTQNKLNFIIDDKVTDEESEIKREKIILNYKNALNDNSEEKICNSIILSSILSIFSTEKKFVKLGKEEFIDNNNRDLESNERLMNILKLNTFPTKEYLINFIFSNDICNHASKDVKDLFLEIYSNNSNINSNITPNYLSILKKSFSLINTISNNPVYNFSDKKKTFLVQGLISFGLVNMFKVYKSVSFKRLQSIFNNDSLSTIEEIAVELSRKNKLNSKFDHQKSLAYFNSVENYNINYYITQLQEIKYTINSDKINEFSHSLSTTIEKLEENGINISKNRIKEMKSINLKANLEIRDKILDNKKNENILKEREELEEKEKQIIEAKHFEQQKQYEKELDVKFKNYMIEKISEITNFIYLNKQRIKVSDLLKDLHKVTAEELVQVFAEEEFNANEKKKKLRDKIHKNMDYEERIRRKLEQKVFEENIIKQNKEIEVISSTQDARRKKCLDILGKNITNIESFFKGKLKEVQPKFDKFVTIRKQYNKDKSNFMQDQIFHFVYKNALVMREEHEIIEEKKNEMMSNPMQKREKFRAENFKNEDTPTTTVGFNRSGLAHTTEISAGPRENKETASGFNRGANFASKDESGPPVFISNKSNDIDKPLITPVSTGFNRANGPTIIPNESSKNKPEPSINTQFSRATNSTIPSSIKTDTDKKPITLNSSSGFIRKTATTDSTLTNPPTFTRNTESTLTQPTFFNTETTNKPIDQPIVSKSTSTTNTSSNQSAFNRQTAMPMTISTSTNNTNSFGRKINNTGTPSTIEFTRQTKSTTTSTTNDFGRQTQKPTTEKKENDFKRKI